MSTQYQVATVIAALSTNVIGLIKDLNGNHVVQKCLNHFTPDDCQFIYNAVTGNLVEVATHRHGCCVLQRAIDHASEPQRIQLVTEITYQSLALVQDAFGNYVVQYILDIDPRFADAVVRQFLGNVPALSCQKFSSNVVEKVRANFDPSCADADSASASRIRRRASCSSRSCSSAPGSSASSTMPLATTSSRPRSTLPRASSARRSSPSSVRCCPRSATCVLGSSWPG